MRLYNETIEQMKESNNVRIFLREDPKEHPNEYHDNYIANQIDACNYFDQWYREPNTSFEDMLKHQHRLAAIGCTGTNYYQVKGWSPDSRLDENKWGVRENFAGMTRRELQSKGIPHVSTDLLSISSAEYAAYSNEKYFREIFNTNIGMIDVKDDVLCNSTIDIDDKRRYTHTFIARNNGFFYIKHVECEEFDLLLSMLSKKMAEIIKQKENGTAELEKLLLNLAIYYQMFLVLMPFAHINNSIVFGQINVILKYWGYNGVPHGWIDSPAMLMSSKNFVPLFCQHIRYNQ
jgi:hypothetical protein